MQGRVLILGGTAEAAALAERLTADGVAVVTSLAGRLSRPPALAGTLRVGGFGGVAGLERFLRQEAITRVVDATHPFATIISAHAEAACARLGLPLEQLRRPEWRRHPGDRWHWADDLPMAARLAPKLGRRVLLTVGARSVAAFAKSGGPFYLVRLIEPPRPSSRLPLRRYALVIGRGPFSLDLEMALMRRFAIDLVVTKASGGAATEAKLTAARRLGIPVLLVRRPDAADGRDRRHRAGCP